MKVFFAIVQAIILGVIAWMVFNIKVNAYKGLASAEPAVLAQKYFDDTSVNSTDSNGEKKYATVEAAQKDAERNIAIGKKVQATSGMKLGIKRVMMTGALAVLGFTGWFIAYFIVYVSTKPLETILDSIWGNFVRYFLGPTGTVSLLGSLLAVGWADYMMQTL